MAPKGMYKYNPSTTTPPAVKLGNRRRLKFHPKPKGAPICHIDLASLLRSYLYTTHKFTIFVLHRLLHQDPNQLYPTLCCHVTHKHALSTTYAYRDPYCPSHH